MHGHMKGRILQKFGSGFGKTRGHMQGHMNERIMEEFGSGARGAMGTCRGT